MSHDPMGLAGGVNLCQYAPNPLSWVDPLGLSKRSLLGKIIKEENKVASPGGHVTSSQLSILKGNLPIVQRCSAFQNKMVRKEFVKGQNYLMQKWEHNTGREWPIGATPHHIIPHPIDFNEKIYPELR